MSGRCACGCAAVLRWSLGVRRNKCRVARAAREQHTQAVLSYAAASAGVTLRRWHLLATDVSTVIVPMRQFSPRAVVCAYAGRTRRLCLMQNMANKLRSQNSPPEASIAPLDDMRTLAQNTRRVRGGAAKLFVRAPVHRAWYDSRRRKTSNGLSNKPTLRTGSVRQTRTLPIQQTKKE